MKKNYLRAISIIASLVIAISLTSCSGEKNPTKNTSSDGKNNSDNKVSYFVPDTIGQNGEDYSNYNPYKDIEKYKGTTVKFATWINHLQTEGADPIASFENKYGIKVELVYCPQETYISDVYSLIASGNSPDVFVDNSDFPLTLNIADDISVTKLDLNEPIWDQSIIKSSSIGDKIYGVNTVNSVWGGDYCMVYNRELLEVNGIKTPLDYIEEGNWTWDSAKEIAKQVKALGNDYQGCAVGNGTALAAKYGTALSIYDNASGNFTSTVQDEGNMKACKFMAELYKEGLIDSKLKFVNGKMAWAIEDTYAIKTTGYFKSMDPLDIGVCEVPVPDKNSEEILGGFRRAYGICKGSKNPVAAGMFIRYFLDPENYVMENTFVNDDAVEYYWKSREKSYNYIKNGGKINYEFLGVGELAGGAQGYSYSVFGGASQVDPAQVATTLATYANKYSAGVEKANQLINQHK